MNVLKFTAPKSKRLSLEESLMIEIYQKINGGKNYTYIPVKLIGVEPHENEKYHIIVVTFDSLKKSHHFDTKFYTVGDPQNVSDQVYYEVFGGVDKSHERSIELMNQIDIS